MMMNHQLLPAEITIEILSRLPIESVVECKRVCKTWRFLINEPAFGDAHTRNHLLRLDHSSSSSCCSSMFLLVTKIQQPNPLRYAVTYEFYCGNYININAAAAADDDDDNHEMGGGFKISKPPNNIDSMHWMMVGSSNGLICLSGDKGVYVYNPFTSEHVNLGHPSFKTSRYTLYGKGFGYLPSTNEYKVVLIPTLCTYTNHHQHVGEGKVSVYMLGSGTWRASKEEEELSHTHSGVSCSIPGVLMNGALHWIRPTMDGNYLEIVSLDLAEEKFISNTIMQLPYSVPAAAAPNRVDDTSNFQLGLLGGCLCITEQNKNSSDIWVMNNRDKSWTMKFKITLKDEYRGCFPFTGTYDPIALLGNGRKILLRCGKTMGIVLYDIETGDIDFDILPNGYQSHDFLHIMYAAAIPFVKSFVSLKTLREEGTKNDSFGGLTPLIINTFRFSTRKSEVQIYA